jgi:pyruvate ferredoxin oxidoreductase delta subunit
MVMNITLGGISKPHSSKNMKTGDWGTEYPVVDEEKCTACKTCEHLCPDGCIVVVKKEDGEKVAVPDYDYCKGCGVCFTVCPADAIKMELKEMYRLEVC